MLLRRRPRSVLLAPGGGGGAGARCAQVFVLLLVAVLLLSVRKLAQFARKSHFCLKSGVATRIADLCLDFAAASVNGSICEDFCGDGRKDGSNLEIDDCLGMHYAKDVVFSAKIRGSDRVIVKGVGLSERNRRIETYSGHRDIKEGLFHDFWHKKRKAKKAAVVGEKTADLTGWRTKYGNADEATASDSTSPATSPETLWRSLHSREYVVLQLMAGTDVVPSVVGACGNYFAVERADPIKTPAFVEFTTREQWRARIGTALDLVVLTDRMEEAGPFVFCDVKSEHYGRNPRSGSINILDADHLYPTVFANGVVADGSPCRVDEDCDHLDCRGTCNKTTMTCSGVGVTNDNLQLVCEKVFLGRYRHYVINFPGLLESRWASRQLTEVVGKCANPDGDAGQRRGAARERWRDRLWDVLQEELKAAKKEDRI